MNPSDVLTGANMVLITVILAITGALKSIFSDFFATVTGQRLLPIVPIVLGVGLAFLGMGSTGEKGAIADKLMVGLLSGLSAAASYKVVKSSVLGTGVEDKAKKE